MKRAYTLALLSVFAAVGASAASTPAQNIVTPQDITWGPAPPSLPAGAQAAVLYGDPGKEGPFAMRLKFPNGYRVPSHTHPVAEVVTVVSGTFHLVLGEAVDDSKAKTLPAGSFFALEAGAAHYGFADEGTIIQINATGPWGITYVNPKDDPRQKTQ